ncbi:MAG TPA: hypothetical protein G4N95_08110 [Anaerolineae bacterium]|nr:hypothetical protein [Anaerolineae bacterium]
MSANLKQDIAINPESNPSELTKMTFLTIFSTPKPFTEPHINIIQRNAIKSWQQLGQDVEVILVGEEEGMDQIVKGFGVKHLPNVERNELGTPLVSSIFRLARDASTSPFLAYVNADILLFPGFLLVARQVAQQSSHFLILGQRWDLNVEELINFDEDWVARMRARVNRHGKYHAPSGSDYFIFPRDAFAEIPDFAIGRAGWDNWMIYHARQQGWLVIDATPSLMIVHQNHDYHHLPNGQPHYDLEETKLNAALGGGMANMYITLDANRVFEDGRIRRPGISFVRVLRTLERWIQPRDDIHQGIRYRVARRLRRLRRKLV